MPRLLPSVRRVMLRAHIARSKSARQLALHAQISPVLAEKVLKHLAELAMSQLQDVGSFTIPSVVAFTTKRRHDGNTTLNGKPYQTRLGRRHIRGEQGMGLPAPKRLRCRISNLLRRKVLALDPH